MPTLKKQKPPFPEGSTVVAITSFSYGDGVVNTGDEYPGDHPLPVANPSWFCDAATPVKERPNTWTDLVPDPPSHRPPVSFLEPIPPHRQVRAIVDTWGPTPWAPGSPGEQARGGIAPPPYGGGLVRGRAYDALDPVVRQHPERFEWPRRDVTIEDLERLERSEDKEG